MNDKVTRLPVQHKNNPQCTACGEFLPNFNDTVCSADLKGATLKAITFHIQCACGKSWDMRKNAS